MRPVYPAPVLLGKGGAPVYASQGQEAFIEGHLEAFRVLGGTPVVQIRYDNLKSAVTRVLFGCNHTESDRWVAFRSHYGFDTFYCLPGVEGAHEKGGVEGEVGRFRRNHLVPMPQVASLVELNARLEQVDAAEDRRRVDSRTLTVGHDFALEQSLLRPLPAEGIDPGADAHRTGRPVLPGDGADGALLGAGPADRAAGEGVAAGVGAGGVRRPDRGRPARPVGPQGLGEPAAGPLPGGPGPQGRGAARRDRAGAQARAAGTFTSAHDAFWALARKAHGDAGGTRAMMEVLLLLLLHRHLAHGDVVAGLAAAVAVGSTSPDVVAVEARKAAQLRGAAPTFGSPGAAAAEPSSVVPARRDRVASLTERRLVEARDRAAAGGQVLPADGRPLPSVAQYDELLAHPPAAEAGPRGA